MYVESHPEYILNNSSSDDFEATLQHFGFSEMICFVGNKFIHLFKYCTWYNV